MTPREWFELIYGDAERGWLTICHKLDAAAQQAPGDPMVPEWVDLSKEDRWVVVEEIVTKLTGRNVYFGLGLRRRKLAKGKRGSKSDVVALPGVWAELDVKATGFASKAEATKWLKTELPFPPSIIVDSGHGLHAYWMFNEPAWLEDDDLEYYESILYGWHKLLSSLTTHHIDSVWDLARILRVPGTTNSKGEESLPVSVVEVNDARYDPSDFEQWATQPKRSNIVLPKIAATGIPNIDKFLALRDASSDFALLWDGTKNPKKDKSPSGYCLALANHMVMGGLQDQEIADLLAYWRQSKGHQPKRAGWYALTIAKARDGEHSPTQGEAESLDRAKEAQDTDERLANLSAALKIGINRITRYQAQDEHGNLSPAWYAVETDRGNIAVPDTKTLISQAPFKTLLADRLKVMIRVSSKVWPDVAQLLLDCSVDEEENVAACPSEEIRVAIEQYVQDMPTTEDPLEAVRGYKLLEYGGKMWFSLMPFCKYAKHDCDLKLWTRNAPRELRAIKSQSKCIDRKWFWSVPEVK